jgi:hypothetical protein
MVYACLPRLVFGGSARLRRKNLDVGPYIGPFFMLDKSISENGLVGEIDEVLLLLMQASSHKVIRREAEAAAKAAIEIWSEADEMSEKEKDRFRRRFDEALVLSAGRLTGKGASLSLLLIEAFEQLRIAGKRHCDKPIQVEKTLVALIGKKLSEMSNKRDAADIKRGMVLGAAAAAAALGRHEVLKSRYDTAARIEKWARK